MNNSNMKRFVVYCRVSTKRQGASGLGLEAQRKICNDFIASHNGESVAEFTDVESGTHRDRKGLADAVSYCKRNGCALVIAKLDRLARDVEFCFKIVNTGIEIHFCDMPQMNTLLLGVFAAVAQYERELTSDRTKKALAAKRERGEATGGATEAWHTAFNSKSRETIKREYMERGKMKNSRFLQRRETQAFLRILKSVFPDACSDDDPTLWDWSKVNTKHGVTTQITRLIDDYKAMDESGVLFSRWTFDEWDEKKTQTRIAAHILNTKNSVLMSKEIDDV